MKTNPSDNWKYELERLCLKFEGDGCQYDLNEMSELELFGLWNRLVRIETEHSLVDL